MARQRLGQHFLADAAWRERIARAVFTASPKTADVWIEIGAGHGEMTAVLSRHANRVVAVELDDNLLPGLHELTLRLGNVTIASGDVLSLDLAAFAEGHDYRVYGNIPYYITSPIVHHLFSAAKPPEVAFLVMQLEVAERLCAKPGGRDYGYLSAFTQFHARSEIVLRIPPGAFRPPPKVDSALVVLQLPGKQASLAVRDEVAFMDFLKLCFSQKRKTLRNNLRSITQKGSIAESLFEQCGIRRDARAEQLSVEELALLFARVWNG